MLHSVAFVFVFVFNKVLKGTMEGRRFAFWRLGLLLACLQLHT